jgi:hypothetical protein
MATTMAAEAILNQITIFFWWFLNPNRQVLSRFSMIISLWCWSMNKVVCAFYSPVQFICVAMVAKKKNQKWPRLPYLLTWQHKLFIMFINIFLKTQTTLNMLIHHSKNNNSDSFLVNLFAPKNHQNIINCPKMALAAIFIAMAAQLVHNVN